MPELTWPFVINIHIFATIHSSCFQNIEQRLSECNQICLICSRYFFLHVSSIILVYSPMQSHADTCISSSTSPHIQSTPLYSTPTINSADFHSIWRIKYNLLIIWFCTTSLFINQQIFPFLAPNNIPYISNQYTKNTFI